MTLPADVGRASVGPAAAGRAAPVPAASVPPAPVPATIGSRAPAAAVHRADAVAELDRPWPLLGRQRELALAMRALQAHRVVAVRAPVAGGLTRFAAELADRWATGLTPDSATAVPTAIAVPAGRRPVVSLCGDRALAETPAGALAVALGTSFPSDGTTRGPELVSRALAATRAALGPDGLLLVDRAAELDPVSQIVVAHVGRSGAVRVILASTAWPDARAPLARLSRDERTVRLTLAPLTPSDLVRAVEAGLDGHLAPGSSERLVQASAGRPGVLRPLVSDLLAHGALVRAPETWVWAGSYPALPLLAEAAEAWLDEATGVARASASPPVSPSARSWREAVEVLAAVGPLPLATAAALVGRAALADAERAGWVCLEPGAARVALAVPALGPALRHRMGQVRVAGWRGRAIEEWSKDQGTGWHRVALAVETGYPISAHDRGRAALEAARDLATDAADLLAQGFVSPTEPSMPGELVRPAFEATSLAAGSLINRAVGAERHQVVDAVSRLARSEAEAARATLLRAIWLYWARGETEAARSLVGDARRATPDRAVWADLTALAAAFAADETRHREAVDLAHAALRAPHGPLTTIMAGYATYSAGLATAQSPEPLPDLAEIDAAWGAAPPLAAAQFVWPCLLAQRCVVLGPHEPQRAVIAAFAARLEGLDDGFARGVSAYLRGTLELARGAVRLAGGLFCDALGAWHTVASPLWVSRAAARAAVCHALTGRPHQARELANQIDESVAVQGLTAAYARGWVAAGEGDTAAALAHWRGARLGARSRGMAGYEVWLAHQEVRLGSSREAPRLTELARRLGDGAPRVSLAAAHARALARRDWGRLGRVAEQLWAAGFVLEAIDALAQAVRGSEDEAGPASHRATLSAWRTQCDDVVTPAIREADRPLPLTGREREVAVLAAKGLSNEQIASHLVVSRRTVEGHLQRCYGKLGLSRRGDLAAALGIVADAVPPLA